MAIKKSFLFIYRRAPYGNSLAREALDVALTSATFDQTVAMLFMGDGVLQLLAQQNPIAIGQKALDKQLAALPLYDIDSIYVDAAALSARGIEVSKLNLPVQLLNAEQITAHIAAHDVVMGF